MSGTKRPTIARHCPKRWTEDDDRQLRAHLALLRDDIADAGGPLAWIHTRLEPWLADPEPRCERPRPRRRVRLQRSAITLP